MSIDGNNTKFAKLLNDITEIHSNRIKCSIQINFGGTEDNVSLRYINIDADDFNKLVLKKTTNGGQNGKTDRTEK